MPTNELILRKVQAGVEGAPGVTGVTGVAANRVVYAQVQPSYERPTATFTDTSGTRFGRRRYAQGRARVGFSATDVGTYEDLPYWFQMAVNGPAGPVRPVSATGALSSAGASSPTGTTGYAYYFKPDSATYTNKSITLEFGEPGNAYKSTQVMVNSWTLRGDPDNDGEPAWMLDLEMIGRDWSTTTYTASLSDRTTEVATARGTLCYLDTSSAIGTTQLTGKLISWSFTGNNNLHYKAFAEDENFMAANKIGFGETTFDGQLVVEFDADTDFFSRYRNGTAIKLKLARYGTAIAGTSPSVSKSLALDVPNAYITGISWGDRDGNITATISFQAYHDSTYGAPFALQVVNGLALALTTGAS